MALEEWLGARTRSDLLSHTVKVWAGQGGEQMLAES